MQMLCQARPNLPSVKSQGASSAFMEYSPRCASPLPPSIPFPPVPLPDMPGSSHVQLSSPWAPPSAHPGENGGREGWQTPPFPGAATSHAALLKPEDNDV